MTPTRADLERRIETWRQELQQHREWMRDYEQKGDGANRHAEAKAARIIGEHIESLAALLTSEGPAQRPETPTVGTCATCRHHAPHHIECLVLVSRPIHHSLFTEWGCTLYKPRPLPDAPKEPTPA